DPGLPRRTGVMAAVAPVPSRSRIGETALRGREDMLPLPPRSGGRLGGGRRQVASSLLSLFRAPPRPSAIGGEGSWAAGPASAQEEVPQASRPWQCLYFLPLPQGQGSLRPIFAPSRTI